MALCCVFGIRVLTTAFLIFFIAYKQRQAYWHERVETKRKRGRGGDAFLSAILLRTKTYKNFCHLCLYFSGFSTKLVCVCILTFSMHAMYLTPSDPSNSITIFGDNCKLQNVWISDVILSILCPIPIMSWKSVMWLKTKNEIFYRTPSNIEMELNGLSRTFFWDPHLIRWNAVMRIIAA